MEAPRRGHRSSEQTHLVGCRLQHLADVIFLLNKGCVDQHCSFGHIWMVMLLQGLDNTRTHETSH